MPKPHFIFHKDAERVTVHVKNLEQLSVLQIQEIQNFVAQRNGYFDFQTYTFTLNKYLTYQEFIQLLQNLGFDAEFEELQVSSQNSARISFGQYKGLLYSELPDSYLLWLKNNYVGKERDIICQEISKRKI